MNIEHIENVYGAGNWQPFSPPFIPFSDHNNNNNNCLERTLYIWMKFNFTKTFVKL